MIRLDKFLAQMNMGTRSEVKNAIRKGKVLLNGEICKNADIKIDENSDVVCYENCEVIYEKFVYYMLNKPAGVVSATKDNLDKTVMDLLCDVKKQDVFPVGRLDKDTEGLLLLTNDGELAHQLISPKNHAEKVYEVELDGEVPNRLIEEFAKGVVLHDGTALKPAGLKITDKNKCVVTLTEGKYHQIKRMFGVYELGVNQLNRIAFGGVLLGNELKEGQAKMLTNNELKLLKNSKK